MVDIGSAIDYMDGVYPTAAAFTTAVADSLSAAYGDHNVTRGLEVAPDTRVDVGVSQDGATVPVECIYETDRATVENRTTGESFDLYTHTMYDTAHYAIVWTLGQLESIVERDFEVGYLVVLTNDAGYWTPPEGVDDARFAELRIHEGRSIEAETLRLLDRREWMNEHDAFVPIEIAGRYAITWEPYDYDDAYDLSRNKEFRYTVFEIHG